MEHRFLLLRDGATHARSRLQKRVAGSFSTNTSVWLLLASFLGTLAHQSLAHGQTGRLVAQRPKANEPEEDEEDGKPEPKKPAPPGKPPVTSQGKAPEDAAKGPAGAASPSQGTELPSEEALEEAKRQAKDLTEEEALQEASDVARARALWQRIELGGALEAEVVRRRDHDGGTSSDLSLKTAEFDFAVKVVDWAIAVLAAEWDPDADKITLNEALITLGKLRKFPFLLQVGRTVVPFGISTGSTVAARLEDVLTISDPLSKAVFESKQDNLLLRFRLRGLLAGAYIFNGKTNSRGRGEGKHLGHWGATLGYAEKRGNLAYMANVYFIDSVFDSESLLSAFPEARYSRYVPGAAVVVRLAFGGFSLASEYNTATRNLEFVRGGQSFQIRPSAWMVEAGFTQRIFGKRSYAALGYSETYQLAGAFPRRRLLPTLATWLFGGFRLAVEYRRDYDYEAVSADAFTFRLTYEW